MRVPTLGLLRQHDFRQLFGADTISQIGTQVSMLALPLVAIRTLHAGNLAIGVLTACQTLAFLLVGLPAGAWVDRMRRRNVLIAGDIGRAVVLASVPLAWWLGVLSMAQLFLVALVTGVCTVFFDVAYQSYLPHLVGRDHLVEGNAKLEAVREASQVGGPPVAGVLIGWLTAPFAIGVDALSYLGSALLVRRIRNREAKPVPRPDAHLGREMREGLRFVLGNPMLRAIALCTGTANLAGTIAGTMFIVLLARTLSLPAVVIGLVSSVTAVGGLVGALTASGIGRRLGQGPTIWISIGVTGPFAILMAVAQRGWLLVAAALGTGVWAFGVVVYDITQVSFRQGFTPERLLGRMNASMRFLVWGTMPIGGLLGGLLGASIGVRPTVWIGTVAGALTFLPVYFSPLRTMRELPSEPVPASGPAGAAVEPDTVVLDADTVALEADTVPRVYTGQATDN